MYFFKSNLLKKNLKKIYIYGKNLQVIFIPVCYSMKRPWSTQLCLSLVLAQLSKVSKLVKANWTSEN